VDPGTESGIIYGIAAKDIGMGLMRRGMIMR
jgi:hypothetical protein